MRSRAASLIPLLLVALMGCPSPQELAEQASGDARQALLEGDRRAAVEALRILEENREETPEALMELVDLLVQAGEAPQALWLLEEGVRRHPDRDDLRLGLARLALMLGTSQTALRALEPIAPDSERDAEALLLRGQATLRAGDLDGALELFRLAEQRHPDRPQAVIASIAALLSERRLDEAAEALALARERFGDGEHADVLRQVEISFHSQQADGDDPEAAIAALREICERHPDDIGALRALANALWRQRDAEGALEIVERAVAAQPERRELRAMRVPLLAALGRREEAEALLRQQVEEVPSASGHAALAHFLLQTDRPEAAREVLRAGLALGPGNALLERLNVETGILLDELDSVRDAIARYRKEHPDDPTGEYLLARLELAEGDAEAAARRLRTAMPQLDDATSQFWLGKALLAAGDAEGAARRFALAVKRASNDPAMYEPLIELARSRGDWNAAAGNAGRVVQLAPGRFDAWMTLTGSLLNAGAAQTAVARAQQFASLFPDEPEAHVMLARAQRAAGDLDAARQALAAAKEGSGDAAAIAAEEALILTAGGDVQQGVEAIRKGLAEHPDSARLHLALGSLLFAVGQAEEGAEAIDRALALDPEDPQPLRVRAEFRAATRDFAGALADARRYLAERADDSYLHFIRAAAHEGLGSRDAAIADYRRAAELDPTAFAPRNNLALLLAQTDLDAALAAAQEAYSLAPTNPQVLDTLGALYLERGLVPRATAMLEEAHAAEPANGQVQYHLAMAYRDGGRTADARRLLDELGEREGVSPGLSQKVAAARQALP